MQFQNPIITQLIIYGSPDNLPDVTIGPGPVITMYNGADIVLQMGIITGNVNPRLLIQNVAGDYVELGLTTNAPIVPRIKFGTAASFAPAEIYMSTTATRDALNLRLTGQSSDPVDLVLREDSLGFGEILVTQEIVAADPAVLFKSETWHAATILSGAGTVEYRLMPDGTVMLRGSIAGAANVVGQALFNLPASYQPDITCRFVCATGTADQTTPGWIQISAAGACVIARPTVAGTAGSFWFDGVRFATSVI